MVTNNEQFVNKNYGGNPITYEKKKAPKKKLVESELWKTDELAFDTKIGYITNCSTTLYSMLSNFETDSMEYKEIENRLKLCREFQGSQIDGAKMGIRGKSIPQSWVRWNKDLSDLEKNIIIDKRPYFMRYLYSDKNRDYRKYISAYEYSCNSHFGISLRQLLEKSELTKEECEFLARFYKYNSLLDNVSSMNMICHYMENKIKELKERKTISDPEISLLLRNKSIPFDEKKLKELDAIYRKYKSEKRYFRDLKDSNGEDRYKTIEQYNKYIRQECMKISSNDSELANLAVMICYDVFPSDNKGFAWNIFGDAIVSNIEKNKKEPILIPMQDDNGKITYLGKKYSKKEISIEDSGDYDEYSF